jgi:hypothetical protein
MIILTSLSGEYIFYWKEDGPPQGNDNQGFVQFAEIGFGSPQQALMFLRRFGALAEYKEMLSQRFPGQVYRWRTSELEARIADLLVKKRICVLKRWMVAPGAPTAQGGPVGRVERRPVVERTEPAEPPTFLANHDGPSQAAALLAAAIGGEPFCEECEKARQQQQAPASSATSEAPQEPSFPPDHNNDAQARTLIEASEEGVPFCEECNQAAA